MIKTQLTILPFVVFQMFTAVNDFHKEIPVPIKINEDRGRTETRIALEILGAPKQHLENLTNGVYAASVATGIDPILIASIIPKESEFKPKARSHLGYKGLMQTPHAFQTWDMAAADIMAGSLVLKDKFRAAKGDLQKAMALYKGGDNPLAHKIAKEQLSFYRETRQSVLTKIKD